MPRSKPQDTGKFRTQIMRSALCIAVFAALNVNTAAAQTPSNVTGIWYDSAGEGGIEVAPCGNRMCGRIVWLKKLINAEGKPLHDRFNPDVTKQSRPICGLQILRDLQPLTDGSWGRGIVYDPKKGAENEASIKPLAGGKLQLTGYGVFGLSKSFEWTRAPADLPRCGPQAVQAGATPGAPVTAAKNVIAPAPATAATKPATAAAGAASVPVIAKPVSPPPASASKPAVAPAPAPVPKPSSAAPTQKPVVKPDDKASDLSKKPPSNTQPKAAVASGTAAGKSNTVAKPVVAAKPVVSKSSTSAAVQKKVTAPTVKSATKTAPSKTETSTGATTAAAASNKSAAAAASNKKTAAPATVAKATKAQTAPVVAAPAASVAPPPVAGIPPATEPAMRVEKSRESPAPAIAASPTASSPMAAGFAE